MDARLLKLLAPPLVAQRQHGKGGRCVRLELADVGRRVALLVNRNAPPAAGIRFKLGPDR